MAAADGPTARARVGQAADAAAVCAGVGWPRQDATVGTACEREPLTYKITLAYGQPS